MNAPITRLALCACLLALAACEKTPPNPPKPIVQTMPSTPADVPSVAAASPLPPASGPTPYTAPSKADGTRNPAQASQGVPQPGQNNDHSAPLGPGKTTSTP